MQLQEINNEIQKIYEVTFEEIGRMKKSEFTRIKKRLELLRMLKAYIETNPSNEFIEQEILRLEEIVNSKMLEFNPGNYDKMPKSEVAKLKKEHEKMYNIPHLRTQLRVLRLIQQ